MNERKLFHRRSVNSGFPLSQKASDSIPRRSSLRVAGHTFVRSCPHHSPFFHHEILANETYYSSCFLPTPPPNLRDASPEQTDTPELLIKLRERRGHGWFEYFMGCSAKPRLARINEQEVLTENIKLLLSAFIYASSSTYIRASTHTHTHTHIH